MRRLVHRARWQAEQAQDREEGGIEQLRFYSQLSPAGRQPQPGKAGQS